MQKLKIVIAIDSFKGSMTSVEAGNASALGIKRCFPDAQIQVLPIADGGEGTVEALVEGLNGSFKSVTVKNPLYRDTVAQYGIVGNTAIIEMASASGIALLQKEELNLMIATTYGVGEIIKDAIFSGCRDFIIGIGGSATNDGGVGMLQALGFEFLDEDKNAVSFGAVVLDKIKYINDEYVLPELKDCKFNIACDVKNPLYGKNGCSAVFAAQKGATPEQIGILDKSIIHYANKTKEKYPMTDPNFAGSGAAGGLGFAFRSYLNGKLQSGIELILEKINIEKSIKDADLVITGEGRLDSQTIMGKAPIGIAKLAKKHKKPVIALSGCVTNEATVCNAHGIDAFFPIIRTPCTLDEAMNSQNAKNNMADCVEQVMRVWKLAKIQYNKMSKKH